MHSSRSAIEAPDDKQAQMEGKRPPMIGKASLVNGKEP
jgi:hypothetical protein